MHLARLFDLGIVRPRKKTIQLLPLVHHVNHGNAQSSNHFFPFYMSL